MPRSLTTLGLVFTALLSSSVCLSLPGDDDHRLLIPRYDSGSEIELGGGLGVAAHPQRLARRKGGQGVPISDETMSQVHAVMDQLCTKR